MAFLKFKQVITFTTTYFCIRNDQRSAWAEADTVAMFHVPFVVLQGTLQDKPYFLFLKKMCLQGQTTGWEMAGCQVESSL